MVISDIMDTKIIPVLLLPVTGLLALVFYNRLATIHQRLRLLQKELREKLLEKEDRSDKEKSVTQVLHREIKELHRRGRWIKTSLLCILLAVASFSFCALFVGLNLFLSWTMPVAVTFWFFGPVLICVGAITGMIELITSTRTTYLQSHLIHSWNPSDDER